MNDCLRLIAYGDCNTSCLPGGDGLAFPEEVASVLGAEVKNLGHTMSTTRELLRLARDFPPADHGIALIQYGLVDSWLTFRHAPYVLYYPDNPWRKVLRKLVKKIKKCARSLRLQNLLGAANVVPLDEYRHNIRTVVTAAPATRFYIISTAPNLDEPRNPIITSYNKALADLCAELPNATYIETYATLYPRRHELYLADGTHLNAAGQAVVTELVLDTLRTARS